MDRRILDLGPGTGSKNKGVGLEMTWGLKVRRVSLSVGFVAALSLASGAGWGGWVEGIIWTLWRF
jgi:hypothetical protein